MAAFLALASLATLALGQDVGTPAPTPAPSSVPRHGVRTVCYVDGGASYRGSPVQFEPEDVDTSLCSILVFASAHLDSTGTMVVPANPGDQELYQRLVSLKRERKNLKVMLSVGGFFQGGDMFTKTVASNQTMHAFAASLIAYLHKFGFDGVDIDWEYPGEGASPPGDKEKFTELLKVLKKDFSKDFHQTHRTRLLLSAAVSLSNNRLTHSYDLPAIANISDWVNLMTYDMHDASENMTGHHSALYSPTAKEEDSIDYGLKAVLAAGVPAKKLNLGLSLYGRTFNLSSPAANDLGAATNNKGEPGQYTQEAGFLAYYEVCKLLTEKNMTTTRLPGTKAPYVVDGSRWTGYDDAESIKEKAMYVYNQNLGGVAIWSLDLDDFHGICGGGHFPLMTAMRQGFHEAALVG